MGLLPYDAYIKAGKMFLPYGLQLQDDTAFIRGGRNGSATTGFSFNVPAGVRDRLGARPRRSPPPCAGHRRRSTCRHRHALLLFTDIPIIQSSARHFGSYAGTSDGSNGWVGGFTGFNLGPFFTRTSTSAPSPTSARSTGASSISSTRSPTSA